MGRDVTFTVLETTVSPEIYDLSPSQRKCRFMLEPAVPHMQVYSFNLCRMQCRKEIAYRLCGCAPYFYVKEGMRKYLCLFGLRFWLNVLRILGLVGSLKFNLRFFIPFLFWNLIRALLFTQFLYFSQNLKNDNFLSFEQFSHTLRTLQS